MRGRFFSDRFLFLDGGMGTQLQARGLRPGENPTVFGLAHPDQLIAVHQDYLAAGAQVIFSNTFNAGAARLGTSESSAEAIARSVKIAREAAAGHDARVFLDVGPLGGMLAPYGDLAFEDAYAQFLAQMKAGMEAGAQGIVIETMMDLAETKAAVLAARAAGDVPVLAMMTFRADGRSFTGARPGASAIALAAAGADAVGVNCSLAPSQLMEIVREICASVAIPVAVKANAGLPDPSGAYLLSDEQYVADMAAFIDLGVTIFGGCCGTTPETIRKLRTSFSTRQPVLRSAKTGEFVCSASEVQNLADQVPIGWLDAADNPAVQKAAEEQDGDDLLDLAMELSDDDFGRIGLDFSALGEAEPEALALAVDALQTQIRLPLFLRSAQPAHLELALRRVCGRPAIAVNPDQDHQAIRELASRTGAALWFPHD